MATLDLPDIGTLNVASEGLVMHTFAGFVMKSFVEISSGGTQVLRAHFLSGPEMVKNLRSFANGSQSRFTRADESDGDLPSKRLSISLTSEPSGSAVVEITSVFVCELEETGTWLREVNDSLKLRGRLGELFSAFVDDLGGKISVVCSFEALTTDEHCLQFANAWLAELEEAEHRRCSM